jgi:hypothetical protein
MAEGQALGDAVGVGGIHDGRLAERAAAFWAFALAEMAAACAATQDFSGAGDLESLGHGLFGFDAFGTSHNQFLSEKERAI